jgi:hypothetical protein
MIQIALTPDELTLVLAALDSHEWDSESDDEINAVVALVRRLEAARRGTTPPRSP